MLPAAPVGSRIFPADDELALFAEVYDNAGGYAAQGRHHDDGDGRRGQGDVQDRRTCAIRPTCRGRAAATATRRGCRSKDLAPGLYVLKVEARSRLGQGPTADRQVQFRIVEPAPAGSPSERNDRDVGACCWRCCCRPAVPPLRSVEKGAESHGRRSSARSTVRDARRVGVAVARARARTGRSRRSTSPARWSSACSWARGRPPASRVEIVGYRDAGDGVVVQYRETTPDRGAITAQILVSPYHLVAIPKRTGR